MKVDMGGGSILIFDWNSQCVSYEKNARVEVLVSIKPGPKEGFIFTFMEGRILLSDAVPELLECLLLGGLCDANEDVQLISTIYFLMALTQRMVIEKTR